MGTLEAIFKVTRPKQWVKNIIVLLGLLFSGSFLDTSNIKAAFLTFFSFIFISAGVYIINDIKDRHNDAHHPTKKNRPIASGDLSVKTAALCSLIFMSIAFSLSYYVNPAVLISVFIYLVVNLSYSWFIKNYTIVDVFFISSGYLIRIVAGVVAVNELPTIWIITSIMFASLFIGFSKRRGELMKLGATAYNHRKNLEFYTIEFLNAMIFINVAIAIATYLLFVIFQSEKHQLLIITVPFITFAAYRYVYLVFNSDKADSPETIFMDRPLLINNLLWIVLFVLTKLDFLGKDFKLFKLVE